MLYAHPMNTTRYHTVLLTLITMAVGALLIVAFVATNAAHARFVCSGDTYTVQPGDTLFGIAIEHCEGNILNAVYHLEQTTGGSLIHPGQTITLPRQG